MVSDGKIQRVASRKKPHEEALDCIRRICRSFSPGLQRIRTGDAMRPRGPMPLALNIARTR
jgi:hypothetical protein